MNADQNRVNAIAGRALDCRLKAEGRTDESGPLSKVMVEMIGDRQDMTAGELQGILDDVLKIHPFDGISGGV